VKKIILLLCLFSCSGLLRASNVTNVMVGGIEYHYRLVPGGAEIVPGGSYSPIYNSNVQSPLSLTIPSALNGHPVVSIGGSAFSLCTNLTSVVIPDTVTSIGPYAFTYCGLKSVHIGASVKTIGENAFSFCGLTRLDIPDSVTTIGDYAFSEGLEINPIRIGNNVTHIGQRAFARCHALTSITIPDRVKTIGKGAFYNCWRLASADLGAGVETIGESAFDGCSSLATVHIGESMRQIGAWAFANCGIVSLALPDSVITLGIGAFYRCNSLEVLTVGSGITSIPDFTFQGCCSLLFFNIPDSIVSIGKDAFEGCERLKSINIGSGVKTIGDHAFKNCYGLKAVCFQGNAPKNVGRDIYSLTPPDMTSYVPSPSWGWDGFDIWTGEPLSTYLPPLWQDRPISHSPRFNVTFDEQGGSAVEDRSYLDLFRDTTYGELPVSTRLGYTFLGWFLESGERVFPDRLIERRHHVITARWQANRVTVTFNSQGGTAPSPSSKTVMHGATYGPLATTTRAGYTLGGWWTGADGTGTEVTSGTTVTITANQTLHAKWTANSYTLTVTGGSGSSSYTNGARVTITANPPAVGKTFDRWTGATQHLASVLSSPTTVTMPFSNITVTAMYKDIQYTLTVTGGSGGGTTFTNGQKVAISANPPAADKAFDRWTGATQYVGNVTSSTTVVTMPAENITVISTYKEGYRLSVFSGAGGGVLYTNGQRVVITAYSPDVRKSFDQWVGDVQYVDCTTSSVTTVTMPAQAIALEATYCFAPKWSVYEGKLQHQLIGFKGEDTPVIQKEALSALAVVYTSKENSGCVWIEWSAAGVAADCMDVNCTVYQVSDKRDKRDRLIAARELISLSLKGADREAGVFIGASTWTGRYGATEEVSEKQSAPLFGRAISPEDYSHGAGRLRLNQSISTELNNAADVAAIARLLRERIKNFPDVDRLDDLLRSATGE